jgi:hypothetical protein
MRRPALLVWSSETQAALQKKHVHLFCCPLSVVAAEFMVRFRKAETSLYSGLHRLEFARKRHHKDSFRPLRISARTPLDDGGDIGCAILPAWIDTE